MASAAHATAKARKEQAVVLEPFQAQGQSMKETAQKELQAIRQASANALHLSLMMYSDERNQDSMRMIVFVIDPVVRFHQLASAARDVSSASRWLLAMCSCKIMEHCAGVVARLRDSSALEALGMTPSTNLTSDQLQDCGFLELAQQDDRACEMMTFGLALVTARLKRNLGFLGSWCLRSVLFLSADGHERAGALQEVKDKYERYCRFRDNGSFLVKRRIRCSMFETTAARQQVELLEKSGWVLDQEVSAYARRKSLRFATSQLCEDGFNRLKRVAPVASNKQVGSERCFTP